MGVWMQSQEHLLTISPPAAVTSMLAKLVLVPLIMVGLASALDLEGNNGRAAVLIAALPISLASFTLASEYKIGFELLSTNVVLGTALLLPTILVWNLVLDAFDLFPITKVGQ
jgi:predicted permease